MNQRKVLLLVLMIIIEQVVYIQTEDDFSGDRSRRDTWKTSQVLSCIRRLRSIIIRPTKHDVSAEMLNCLNEGKTPKADKKNKKKP